MGGFFGITSKKDCMADVFFGIDYHSHLGTYAGGMAAWDPEIGLQRRIHSIKNAPFRTKFEYIFQEMSGTSVIGCISDTYPQPLLVRARMGAYAITTVGIVNNADELIDELLTGGNDHFDAMTGGKVNETDLVASLINQKGDFVAGIRYAQSRIEGTCCLLILCDDGTLLAARDRLGRLPVQVGRRQNEDGSSDYAVAFEAFAFEKLGFELYKELGPAEIVRVSPDGVEQLAQPGEEMRICSFLWSYYGYPTSTYEGVNVEMMRYRNGQAMAQNDIDSGRVSDIDFIGGVPDSGTPHAIGYASKAHAPFARPFIKYTPTWQRSFMPQVQTDRENVAEMKLIPVPDLIDGKKLLFVDDSIVRGTQLRKTVQFLYRHGAKEVHMRSACPPIMFSCKYLNFSRSTSEMDLIARRVIKELEGEEGFQYLDEYADCSTERGRKLRETICEQLQFDSLEFQSLQGVLDSIGLEPCKLCTYCWNGRE